MAVTNLGGHVLKKLGDGLMALFGYPKAQENDAERAVRAALAIQQALGELQRQRGQGRAAAFGPHRPRRAPWLSTRRARCSVTRRTSRRASRRRPSLARPHHPECPATGGKLSVRRGGGAAYANFGVSSALSSSLRIVRASGGGRRGGMRALTQFVGREEELGLASAPLGGALRQAKANSCSLSANRGLANRG